jgi:hypothetical protein
MNISWGNKRGRYVGLTTLPHSCADCLEIWEPQLRGALKAYPGMQRDLLYLILYEVIGRTASYNFIATGSIE